MNWLSNVDVRIVSKNDQVSTSLISSVSILKGLSQTLAVGYPLQKFFLLDFLLLLLFKNAFLFGRRRKGMCFLPVLQSDRNLNVNKAVVCKSLATTIWQWKFVYIHSSSTRISKLIISFSTTTEPSSKQPRVI